ncbi:MAG: hypothetical protein EXR93_10485 [Gemmatimonadetes bacterium]|nr:hypothetical protein [Gemmatimonadota bacterium]
MRRARSSLAFALALAGCKLTEVVIAPGERTLVVQAVIDRSQPTQFAVVEYSTIGDSTINGGGARIPGGRPGFPVTGAVVSVEHLEGACPGRQEALTEVLPTGTNLTPTGRYAGMLTCLAPGEKLGLRVTTRAGEIVTGETVLAAASAISVRAGGVAARFARDTVRFNRDSDTMRVAIDPLVGRGMQIEVRRAEDHDHIALIFINDSLGAAFPGNLVNPFGNDVGETTFRAGAYYVMTVAMADSNYYHYASTFSDPVTGRGFLNHLKGGLGVFGSIETTQYVIRVSSTVNDPKEGVYRLTGLLGGVNLDLSLESYLDDLSGNGFSAFARGTWTNGATPTLPVQVNVSGDGTFGFTPGVTANDPNAFVFMFDVIRTTNPTFRHYVLRGIRSTDGSPFSVDVTGTTQNGQSAVRGTALGVQVSGPRQ